MKVIQYLGFLLLLKIASTIADVEHYDDTLDVLVQAYENLILGEQEKAESYVPRTNALEFRHTNKEPIDFGTFDFIVIGAGSGGSLMASRLSEVLGWKVLLLEAGQFESNFTSIPGMAYKVSLMSDRNWGYYSVPQRNACLGFEEERCPYPIGQGIGGTSLLNALFYTRGHPTDYEIWGENNPGWTFKDVLPYFLKSEDFSPSDPEAPLDPLYHREGGLLPITYSRPRSPKSKYFFRAYEELGYKYVDLNGANHIGIMPPQMNTKFGRRFDAGTSFVLPALHRKNLNVSTRSFVNKILIDSSTKVAHGVLFSRNNVLYRARALKEVILSAGTLNSPKILMLSGIGPKAHLEELGIPVIQDLEVGSAMKDHLQTFALPFTSNLSEPVFPLREQVLQFLRGEGPLSVATASDAFCYYQTSVEPRKNYPDLEISFGQGNDSNWALSTFFRWKPEVSAAMGGVSDPTSFNIHITPVHTYSTGTVRLRSNDPYDYPLVDPQLLSDPEGKDIRTIYEGILISLKIAETKVMQEIDAKPALKPLSFCNHTEFLSEEYWLCAIPYITDHNNHPTSTCVMGPDPSKGAVVDNRLKVHGIKNLRVADNSVIPIASTAHINSVAYLIGEKGADLIKQEYNE